MPDTREQTEKPPPLALVRRIEGVQVAQGKASAQFVVDGLPGDDGEFEFVFVAKVPSVEVSKESPPLPAVIRRDQHVISAQMQGIGGTPLVRTPVLVVDPDSGEPVAGPIETDDQGNFVATVPENKPYDLRVLDEDEGEPTPVVHDFDPDELDQNARLYCRVIDAASGRPLANQTLEVRGPLGAPRTAQARTDAEGDIELVTDPGAYEVRAGGRTYIVHTLFGDDVGPGGAPYRLEVGG